MPITIPPGEQLEVATSGHFYLMFVLGESGSLEPYSCDTAWELLQDVRHSPKFAQRHRIIRYETSSFVGLGGFSAQAFYEF